MDPRVRKKKLSTSELYSSQLRTPDAEKTPQALLPSPPPAAE